MNIDFSKKIKITSYSISTVAINETDVGFKFILNAFDPDTESTIDIHYTTNSEDEVVQLIKDLKVAKKNNIPLKIDGFITIFQQKQEYAMCTVWMNGWEVPD